MKKLKIIVNIDRTSKTDHFMTCTCTTFQKNNLEKYFLINEQSNITNIKSKSEYLFMTKKLNENFLNLKQYKLEFFKHSKIKNERT